MRELGREGGDVDGGDVGLEGGGDAEGAGAGEDAPSTGAVLAGEICGDGAGRDGAGC